MAEKVKPVLLTDTMDGTKYTLEFDRATVKFAEQRGFSLQDLERYPTTVYDFFFYAFRMHHKNVARDKTDRIIDEGFGGVAGLPPALLERLVELYDASYGTLYNEEQENPRMVVEL